MLNVGVTTNICRGLIITSAALSLSGCDYFSNSWDTTADRCQATSSDRGAVASVSDDGISFVKMEQGCPNNLDGLGTRFTDITINGDRYTATLMCNSATQNRTVAVLGIPDEIPAGDKDDRAWNLIPRAVKEFSAFMGAKVTIEGETFKFGGGNFARACQAYLPNDSEQDEQSHESFFQKLFGNREQAEENTTVSRREEISTTAHRGNTPPNDAQARMMEAAGYEFKNGEWQKKPHPHATTSMSNEEAGFDITNKTIGRSAANKPESTEPVKTLPVSPAQGSFVTDKNLVAYPVNPNCRLDNGKYIYAYASPDGRGYNYTYLDKNEKQELELKDGLFGVTAFHYHSSFGMGSADYIRFNKGIYDYLVINKDNGKDNEFYGLQVFKNGEKIFSRECKGRMDMDFSNYPNNAHRDSDDKADYFLYQ